MSYFHAQDHRMRRVIAAQVAALTIRYPLTYLAASALKARRWMGDRPWQISASRGKRPDEFEYGLEPVARPARRPGERHRLRTGAARRSVHDRHRSLLLAHGRADESRGVVPAASRRPSGQHASPARYGVRFAGVDGQGTRHGQGADTWAGRRASR